MANSLVPQDVYALVNNIVKQATGQESNMTVVDTTSFVSVGETLLRTSAENTLNAISTVLARTIFSTRPYKGRLNSIRTTQERWGAQVRKIVYLYNENEASNDMNTNINASQLADGNSIDHYVIKNPKALQLNFYGTKKLQKHITRYRDQLSLAFTSEAEFMKFIDGMMVEFNNEIELDYENETRLTLVNAMAGVAHYNKENYVDLLALFNEQNGLALTREDVLGTHLETFAKFVAATIKTYSNRLQDLTALYHVAKIGNNNPILRHTPKQKQKMLMYSPLFTQIEANVYSSIFNPEYLNIGTFEEVNYWQNVNDPTGIKCKPNVLNATNGQSTDGGNTTVDYVVGFLYDVEALGVMPQFDYSAVTPFNARGGYSNLWWHHRFNSYTDFTENMILFYIGEGGEATS